MKSFEREALADAVEQARLALARVTQLAEAAVAARPGMSLPALAERLYADRRRRDRIFGNGLFREPAWDLLLALYSAHGRGEPLIFSAAYDAAGLSCASGQRLLAKLQEAGLVALRDAPGSRKKKLAELTPSAADRLSDYLTGLL
jgi:DNA-binding MarR family transcriptional regulator